MAQSAPVLRIGTRGSPLALVQANEVRARFAAAHGLDVATIEIRAIRTTGDVVGERPLAEIGGKGLFTQEIDRALIAGEVDIAVHSAKDMPTILPDALTIAGYLPREDPRDAFISRKADRLARLPPGAIVGTASLRRQAMVKRLRPDVKIVALRGNVETRLRKLEEGAADATVLALAGLKRLNLAGAATCVMDIDEFPPAPGQGAIAICARADDQSLLDRVARISHADTQVALAAERAFLGVLDGSCRTPIAAHAIVAGDEMRLHGLIIKPDGSMAFEARRNGSRKEAAALGRDAGVDLKRRAPADFFHG